MRTTLPRQGIRRPTLAASVAVVLVWACGAGLEAQAGSPTSSANARSGLVGTVLDRANGDPVHGASLELLAPGTDSAVVHTEADSLGAFAFAPLVAGPYTLRIRGFGYRVLSQDVMLEDRVETELTASLVPEAMDLEPLVVSVERRSLGPMRDFEARRARGLGSFITRDDIERRRPNRVSDMFRSLAGVRVVTDRYGDARLLLHGQCVPKLYIDGVAAYEQTSLDMILHPDDVEGIEVYTTATVPPQYERGGGCGVLVVWTRVPQRVEGKSAWWKPMVLLGGLFGAMFLLH